MSSRTDSRTTDARTTDSRTTAERAARAGLWLLPAYAVLLGLGNLTHQPSIKEFDAYARYVTTDIFLVSHLGASIFGAGIAVLGVVAVTAFLIRGRAAVTAVVGLVLTTITNVFMAAAFGSATFVQPGIGRAHLNGVAGMEALNADTAYGPALIITAATSTFLFIVSGIVLGTAIARTSPRLRWDGVAYAALIPIYALSGFLFQTVQPIAGFVLAVVTAALAVRLPGAVAESGTDRTPVRADKTPVAA
ncbi:MAG TPA: hypothetical protein VK453_00815 [Micromonosporaceae bacterium]|nr:hypothetical protein [Micromonosporaceae bacterium]